MKYDTASAYTLDDVSYLYKSVSQCMGTATNNGPLAIFVSSIGYDESGAPYGGYYFDDGLMLVATQNNYVIVHEFIHHALSTTGASNEENWGHRSPSFRGACSQIEINMANPIKPEITS